MPGAKRVGSKDHSQKIPYLDQKLGFGPVKTGSACGCTEGGGVGCIPLTGSGGELWCGVRPPTPGNTTITAFRVWPPSPAGQAVSMPRDRRAPPDSVRVRNLQAPVTAVTTAAAVPQHRRAPVRPGRVHTHRTEDTSPGGRPFLRGGYIRTRVLHHLRAARPEPGPARWDPPPARTGLPDTHPAHVRTWVVSAAAPP